MLAKGVDENGKEFEQRIYKMCIRDRKSTKSVNSTGETGNTKELSEAEEMAIFKKEFYAEIDKIPRNLSLIHILPHRAVAVYLYLETRADRERTCYPAIGTIARELHLSVSTVKRAIHDLECAGFIQKKQRWRENGGKSSLLYEIIK